jgi:hypothetical protein
MARLRCGKSRSCLRAYSGPAILRLSASCSPCLACVTVQQVFLDGKPVDGQAPDSEPTEWRSPSKAFELRQRPLSTAMPLDGKEKVLDADPRTEIRRAARARMKSRNPQVADSIG